MKKKRIYTIKNKILVEGSENLLTKNEILVSNDKGKITLKEVSTKGKVVTISGEEGNSSNQESQFYYFNTALFDETINEIMSNLPLFMTMVAMQVTEDSDAGIRKRLYFNLNFNPGSGHPDTDTQYIQVPKHVCVDSGICATIFEALAFKEWDSDLLAIMENPEPFKSRVKEIESILTPCMVTEEVFFNGKKPDFNELIDLYKQVYG